MKRINLFILIILYSFTTFASNVKSEIKEIIVYQYQAKISRVAEAIIPAGNNEIVLEDLTNNLLQNTLQVDIIGNATLLSATTRKNFISNKTQDTRYIQLKDSLDYLKNELDWSKRQIQVYEDEKTVINKNDKLISEEKGMNVDDLVQFVTFYRKRLLDINKEILSLKNKEIELNTEIVKIQQQLNELNAGQQYETTEIVLNISCDKLTKVKVVFSYIADNAGWTPVYDLRSQGVNKPTKLIYKANVYQNTGYDWNNVKLSISTGNPSADNSRPLLNPWYIDFYVPPPPVYRKYEMKSDMQQSQMMNIAQEAVVYDEVSVYEEMPEAEVSGIGYNVSVSQNQIAAKYDIEASQDIPSDGKNHLVALMEYELKSDYIYHTVPKLSEGVFLLAKVSDYGKYNLLPGNANIFSEGMYTGQSYINPNITADTLLLSLGRDNNITAKRNILKDYSSKQTIGKNVKETKGYEIVLRNNYPYPVEIEVLDNVPISKNKEIIIEIEEMGNANYTADFGKLLWRLSIDKNETKKIHFIYSVRYPKEKNISGL